MCKGGGTLRSTSHHLTLRIRPLFQLQGGEVYGWMNFGTCLLQVSLIVPRASRGNLDRTLDRCLVFSFLFFLYNYSRSNDERPLKGLERFDGETSCRMERLD